MTWYYRRYRASDFKVGGKVTGQYAWNWFFARFTLVYPWLAGFAASLIAKPLIPTFGLARDFDSLVGLVVGFGLILNLIVCWLVTAIKGPGWVEAKN